MGLQSHSKSQYKATKEERQVMKPYKSSIFKTPNFFKFISFFLYVWVLTVPSTIYASDENVSSSVNFQGFSGLFNVPTGESLSYGEFHFNYNNLADSPNGKFGDFGTQYTDGKVVLHN